MLDFDFIRENWLFIAGGLGETMLISVLAVVPALPIALLVGYGRRSSFFPFAALSTLYASVIDATPLILQIFFIFLALPQLEIFLPGLLAGALVLGLNSSARMSEVFRMWFTLTKEGKSRSWEYLIPSLNNELVALIKDSALISIAGFVHEIMWRATKTGRATFHNLEALLIALLIYWVIILIVSIPKIVHSITSRSAKSPEQMKTNP